MERTGPESLTLMAAAPIFRPSAGVGRPLWEVPAEVDRLGPSLLAAAPASVAPSRPARAVRLLAWLHVPRAEAPSARF